MTRHLWVKDLEAYAERRAIMEVEGVDPLTASREANESAYKTRLGRVATAAANGNWDQANAWCAETAERFGPDAGKELMRYIEANIAKDLEWRR